MNLNSRRFRIAWLVFVGLLASCGHEPQINEEEEDVPAISTDLEEEMEERKRVILEEIDYPNPSLIPIIITANPHD